MMRPDQKLLSYHCLADALHRLPHLPWSLVIAGAGPAEAEVRRAFAPFESRVRWAGMLDRETLGKLYRAADVFAWPAIKEAWGMVLLEAQAAGLPVVAGRSGGVASVVADGETGALAPEGDDAAFAEALGALLGNPELRMVMRPSRGDPRCPRARSRRRGQSAIPATSPKSSPRSGDDGASGDSPCAHGLE
jgi:glycosyltransferase involved in cell wall biosynthesis